MPPFHGRRLAAYERIVEEETVSELDRLRELLTLLAAGHETTATTLAWAWSGWRRHPSVLRDLVDEVDAGGSAPAPP